MFIKKKLFKKLVMWIVFYISWWYEILWYKKGKWQPQKIPMTKIHQNLFM